MFHLEPHDAYIRSIIWSSSLSIVVVDCHLVGVGVTLPSMKHEKFILMDVISKFHDDVIKWKHFPRNWPFVRGIHRSPVNSTHKGQWRGALMFSLICTRINVWVNNGDAADLRRHRDHYGVIVMRTLVFKEAGSGRFHKICPGADELVTCAILQPYNRYCLDATRTYWYCHFIKWVTVNKLQWNLYFHAKIYFQTNASVDVVCGLSAILLRPRYDNSHAPSFLIRSSGVKRIGYCC